MRWPKGEYTLFLSYGNLHRVFYTTQGETVLDFGSVMLVYLMKIQKAYDIQMIRAASGHYPTRSECGHHAGEETA
jgi:hypothetical protein